MPVDGAASVVQMVLSLIAVVAIILGLAWMARRMQFARGGAGSELSVRATLAVGIKERVVIVEAAGQRFLIGVAPGQVSILKALGPVHDAPSSSSAGPHDADVPAKADADGAMRMSFADAFSVQLNKLLGR
jgi:flagellar protein FliO/FliZ